MKTIFLVGRRTQVVGSIEEWIHIEYCCGSSKSGDDSEGKMIPNLSIKEFSVNLEIMVSFEW